MEHAFIFDMDGVIVDSNPYHKIALQQFCEKHGYHLSEEDLRNKIYGRTNKEWIVNLFGPLSQEKLDSYEDEKEALYRRLFEKDITPVKGILGFLKKMDEQGIRRAIGTSAPRVNVDFTLSKTGTTQFYNIILDESHVTKGKPNPEIYLNVSAALGLPPENCIVFEDSLSGVQAGKKAGCKVVGITTTHTREELFETDFVIDDFEGLDPGKLIARLFEE